MCTVSFIARKNGYLLGMNRDEKLTRVRGLPPQKATVEGRVVLSPREPNGGTWIGVNDTGVCFALINWYSVKTAALSNAISRGEVVKSVQPVISPTLLSQKLRQLPLKRMKPFRLIGVFPAFRKIFEWRWNQKRLVQMPRSWRTQQFISSGFNEPTARRVRGETFRLKRKQRSFGALRWLRRLHRSHAPQRGPFCTCIHRPDAATVSYTELMVSPGHARMGYASGAPCQQHPLSFHALPLSEPS